MGIRNKERRRAKKQHREPRDHKGSSGPSRLYPDGGKVFQRGTSDALSDLVDMLITRAAHAACEGDDAKPVLARLLDRQTGPGWCLLVTDRVALALAEHLTLALHSGWEPRDISALVRRKVGPTAANIAEAVLPDAVRRRQPDNSRLARWQGQLDDLVPGTRPLDRGSPTWEGDIGAAVSVIGLLAHLASLPDLGSPSPRRATRPDLDPGVLDKVRALLAKAEATVFEEEADAFLSKAQGFMTRHNLDRAAVEEAHEDGVAGIEARRCWLDDPYLKQKGYLLAVVARANRCRSVSLYEYGFVTLFGHPDDLSTTEMLFTALLVHATKQMTLPLRSPRTKSASMSRASLMEGPPPDRRALEQLLFSMARPDASRPSYRRSFLLAYATRIGARLSEASSAATQDALGSAGEALLPVLANREHGVDEALAKMFPDTTTSEFSVTDHAGWAAGQAAADLADLSWQPKLAGSTT